MSPAKTVRGVPGESPMAARPGDLPVLESKSGGQWKLLVILVSVLALVGVGAAGWTGFSWWSTVRESTASTETATARDGAMNAVKDLAAVLQTVDANRPEDSMKSWEEASTGPLLAKLTDERAKFLDDLKKKPTTSSAAVIDAALVDLDAKAGTANAVAALDVTQSSIVRGQPEPPIVRHLRVKLALSRTSAGWKVSNSALVNAG